MPSTDVRDRPRRAQQDVLVAVRDDVIGEHPRVDEEAADEPDHQPPQRDDDPERHARPARSRRAPAPAPKIASPTATPQAKNFGVARRRHQQRRRPIAREPARPVRAPAVARRRWCRGAARSSSGKYISVHSIDRLVHLRTENDVQRQVQPQRLRRHPQRVLRAASSVRARARWHENRPCSRAIDRVAHARRTVVEEVVVLVEAVLGPRVHLQRLLQFASSSPAADSAPGS